MMKRSVWRPFSVVERIVEWGEKDEDYSHQGIERRTLVIGTPVGPLLIVKSLLFGNDDDDHEEKSGSREGAWARWRCWITWISSGRSREKS